LATSAAYYYYYMANYALSGRKKMDELIALMNNAFIARPEHDRVFIDAKNAKLLKPS
jgi:hypothetical protein